MNSSFSTTSIDQLFDDYLARLGVSKKTSKNYHSDISHFTSWLILKLRSYGSVIQQLGEAVPFLSQELAGEYKNFLIENGVPAKTLNRRLTTIRHLARFFLESQILDFDFMQHVQNITLSKGIKPDHGRLVSNFQRHLESQNVSHNTVKNYVSDVRQFLSWLETNR